MQKFKDVAVGAVRYVVFGSGGRGGDANGMTITRMPLVHCVTICDRYL